MRFPNSANSLAPILSIAFPLAGCTVGPDYVRPIAISSTPAKFVRAGDVGMATAPAMSRWWTGLGDATLNTLEDRALAANPSIGVAQARLQQARASLRLERANTLPSASANASYLHAQLPGINIGQASSSETGDGASSSSNGNTSAVNFFNFGFDASWEIDLFGGRRRSVEVARATLQGAEANVADAQVSLTAEVAQTYVNLRDRQARITLSRQSSEIQRRMLTLTQQRFSRGTASALDVERLRLQVENTDAQVLPLGAEVDSYLNALAVLTGEAPGALDTMLVAPAPVPLVPAVVLVGDPAALIARRPDIRAAERRLAADTARIGVQEAERLPSISILGLIGLGGTSIGDVVDPDNLTALATPMLRWNFLDFGRGAARVGQARSTRDEAEANYRQTVLSALRDAEDALSRFGNRRQTVASLARARASADRASVLTNQRYQGGTATLIDVHDTERQRVSAEQQLSTAIASLTSDYVALQKSLGLGWQPLVTAVTAFPDDERRR